VRRAFLYLLITVASQALSQTQCKANFAVVWKDPLNNTQQGLSKDDFKWFQKKLQGKYPSICYDAGTPPLVFFVSISTSTYHGTRIASSTDTGPVEGTVTDDNGNTSHVSGTQTVTSHTAVPYSFDYHILTLSIEEKQGDGTWKVRHNFQKNTICRALFGSCFSNRHPNREIIEKAVEWIAKGGLTDPMQNVLVPGETPKN
jgi:hypothetical protein